MTTDKEDELSLKWGTLKGYHLHSEAALAAMERYFSIEKHSVSAMAQRDTDEQKQALLEVIDSLNVDRVYLSWDGKHVSKEEAKKYVTEYNVR